LSVTLFEKIDMYQLLTESSVSIEDANITNQLNLFNI
jgi:hypothetical protein